MSDREERIRARAHEIWEQAGMPLGEDMRHWEQAALEIDEEDAAAAASGGSAEAAGAVSETPASATGPDEENAAGPA